MFSDFLFVLFAANAEGVGDYQDKVVSVTENCFGRCPRSDKFSQRNQVSPIPQSLREALEEAFDDPLVWWMGQCFELLTRPNSELQSALEDTKTELNFTRPIAG